jgi:hypothetical protein
MRNKYKASVTKPQITTTLGVERKIILKLLKVRYEGVKWIQLAQDTFQGQDLVNTVTEPRVP